MAVASFIADLASRLAQLQSVAQSTDYAEGIWLGELFQPEAFITATRQTVAHKNGWSLEQLVLQLGIEQPDTAESFGVRGKFGTELYSTSRMVADLSGLKLEGSSWSSSGLTLNEGGSVNLGTSQLTWERIDACKIASKSVNIPVYLNGDRLDVLFAVDLASDVSQATVAQRGVCLTAA